MYSDDELHSGHKWKQPRVTPQESTNVRNHCGNISSCSSVIYTSSQLGRAFNMSLWNANYSKSSRGSLPFSSCIFCAQIWVIYHKMWRWYHKQISCDRYLGIYGKYEDYEMIFAQRMTASQMLHDQVRKSKMRRRRRTRTEVTTIVAMHCHLSSGFDQVITLLLMIIGLSATKPICHNI